MLKDLARALGGIALVGMALATAGCEGTSFNIEGRKGVPLAELDLSGKAPEEISLLGPDKVRVIQGDKLAIAVEGDQSVKDRLRFVLGDGKLGIGRDRWNSGDTEGIATISVTVPDARRLVLAGSGTLDADALRGENVGVTIAGSGTVNAALIGAGELKVEVLGSGALKAAGKARALKLTVAGSGVADMPALSAESADVDVAGSGTANFASDGNVKANIMGSGEVHVKGRATCKITSMGSGKLVCEP